MLECRKVVGVSLAIILLFIAFVSYVSHAQIRPPTVQPPTVYEIQGVRTINVLDTGVAEVKEEIKFSAQAYIAFKRNYNPLSTFVRELEPRTNPVQIENLSINVDDANNKLTATYTLLGAAVYKGNGLWEIDVAEPGGKLTLTAQHGNTLVFANVYGVGEDYKLMETVTVNLPAGAKNVKYREDEGKITYELSVSTGASNDSMLYAGIALSIIGGAMIAVSNMKKRGEYRPTPPLPPPPPPPVSSWRK